MKKTVIKRRKRIIPTHYPSGPLTPQHHRPEGPPSTSSNTPSPPATRRSLSPRLSNPFGPLPPPWPSGRNPSQTYSPEPQDFTNYRPSYSTSPNFPPSYNEQNTLPPIRLPLGAHSQPLSPTEIQHVGGAIPLPKRKLESSPPVGSKRLRSIDSLLNPHGSPNPSQYDEPDPLEGARVLLSLGSRESVIRKRAELMGEIDVFNEKLEKLRKAVAECDEFLGR
jgi:hypothetical protein